MKFKRGLAFNQVDKLGLVALISSTGLAIIGTIWAIYLDSFFHNASYVGFLSTFFAIVTFASYIFTVPIIEKNSKSKIKKEQHKTEDKNKPRKQLKPNEEQIVKDMFGE